MRRSLEELPAALVRILHAANERAEELEAGARESARLAREEPARARYTLDQKTASKLRDRAAQLRRDVDSWSELAAAARHLAEAIKGEQLPSPLGFGVQPPDLGET